jgi:hypothetical protein
MISRRNCLFSKARCVLVRLSATAGVCAYLAGCGEYAENTAGNDEGDLATIEEAWGVESCKTPAGSSLPIQWNGLIVRGAYNLCDRSSINDLRDLDKGPAGGQTWSAIWADDVPDNQGQCEKTSATDKDYTWGGVIAYKKSSISAAWTYLGTREAYGTWRTSGTCTTAYGSLKAPCCEPPKVYSNDATKIPRVGYFRAAVSFRRYDWGDAGVVRRFALSSAAIPSAPEPVVQAR